MSKLQRTECDVLIVGAGFSGALLAWMLAKHGLDVVLIDRQKHPRFAIGESSTPLADSLLEAIADEFALPELKPLSRWGTWQAQRPELRAGKKRGFSYFQHSSHQAFRESDQNERSLLVSASVDDRVADTHWHRGDVDQWICQRAVDAGAALFEHFHIEEIQRTEAGWRLSGNGFEFLGRQWVDASGGAGLLGRHLKLRREELRTQNAVLYGHFEQVGSMDDLCREATNSKDWGFPFWSDDAAQHHLISNGWVWMLRFGEYDQGHASKLASLGIVAPASQFRRQESLMGASIAQGDAVWRAMLQPYPSLVALLEDAKLVAPRQSDGPALGWIARCSRLWQQAASRNAVMLPGTAGIVDPLHSTGIAHGLYGVYRVGHSLIDAFQESGGQATVDWIATSYASDVLREIRWIDDIVNLAYACLPQHAEEFPLFAAACAFYFVAAIHSEENFTRHRELPDGFLLVDNALLRSAVQEYRRALSAAGRINAEQRAPLPPGEVRRLVELARELIQPWNHVGLLDPSLQNRLARSAADKG